MTYTDRATILSHKIPKLKELKNEKKRLDEYSERKKQLVEASQILGALSLVVDALRDRGGDVSGFKKSVLGLRKEVRRLGAAFEANPGVIIAPETTKTFWYQLNPMPDKVKKEIEKEWKKFVESQIPPIQADILTILSRVQGFSKQADLVSKQRAKMQDMGSALPQEGSFEALDELAKQVEEAWNALNGEGMPQSVLDFFKKAHFHGFSLADIDEEITDWLKEKNLIEKYVVRVQ